MSAESRAGAVIATLLSAAFVLAVAFLLAAPAPAVAESPLPAPLEEVAFEQRLGAEVPLDLAFRDERGREVELGSYFGSRPVVLVLVYYECPMLCTLVLNGLVSSLEAVPFDPGTDFEIATVSFDPRETPELAAAKKASYLERYGRPGAAGAWHFLTGEADAIRALTEAIGFGYAYDPDRGEFAHASGIFVLTPDGRISRVLYGIEYAPRDLRLALVEASAGEIGSFIDQLLLYCFHYDPETGTYGAAALGLVRAGGMVTVALLAAALLGMRRRERRERRERQPAGGR